MNKLAKSKIPDAHSLDDFECFGPIAKKDGEISGTRLVDLGCFTQDGKDSNKFYFGCVSKSRKNGKWYVYFEWGRTGSTPDFQFYECESEGEAQGIYEKQIHSKNDKRGEWFNHPALGKILRAKAGKDCYLVQVKAVRNTGLPDARKLTTKTQTVISSSNYDKETESLLKDLKLGTVAYAKGSFSSGHIPDISAINEARQILVEILKPKSDKDLVKLLYSKIPKATTVGEKVEINKDNAKDWFDDLDAFEDAFNNLNSSSVVSSTKYELKYIPTINQEYQNIVRFIESGTRNRHSYISGKIKVLNLWKVENSSPAFIKKQQEIAKSCNDKNIPVIFQPEKSQVEKDSNTMLLFHGTRSVNCQGLLSEGFKLPRQLNNIQINGANLGPGCYHACDWKKSAGYCSINNGYWSNGSGKIQNRHAFMFINDVILGNAFYVDKPKNFSEPPKNYNSVIATTNGSFQNEEFVVYTIDQIWPKYLIEFNI